MMVFIIVQAFKHVIQKITFWIVFTYIKRNILITIRVVQTLNHTALLKSTPPAFCIQLCRYMNKDISSCLEIVSVVEANIINVVKCHCLLK